MSGYIVSPKADEDIFEIWGYLYEQAGVEIANRVEAEIYNVFETLSRNPGLGHKRSDLTSHAVLFFAVYSYMIVYRSSTPHACFTVNVIETNPGKILTTLRRSRRRSETMPHLRR